MDYRERITIDPDAAPPAEVEHTTFGEIMHGLLPPLLLIMVVLGSILSGAATLTRTAGSAATGAPLLALTKRQMNVARMREVVINSMEVTAMVFMILIGAAVFSLVFRGFGGDEYVQSLLSALPGGQVL